MWHSRSPLYVVICAVCSLVAFWMYILFVPHPTPVHTKSDAQFANLGNRYSAIMKEMKRLQSVLAESEAEKASLKSGMDLLSQSKESALAKSESLQTALRQMEMRHDALMLASNAKIASSNEALQAALRQMEARKLELSHCELSLQIDENEKIAFSKDSLASTNKKSRGEFINSMRVNKETASWPVFPSFPSGNTTSARWLIAVAAYGANKGHRAALIISVSRVCLLGHYVTLVVDFAKEQDGQWRQLLNSVKWPCKERTRILLREHDASVGHGLAAMHQQLFAANLHAFDWFMYTEEDVGWTPQTLTTFVNEFHKFQAVLGSAAPLPVLPGFVRWEAIEKLKTLNTVQTMADRATRETLNSVALEAVIPNDLWWNWLAGVRNRTTINAEVYVEPLNLGQGMWILPRNDLQQRWANGTRMPWASKHHRCKREYFGSGWLFECRSFGGHIPCGCGPDVELAEGVSCMEKTMPVAQGDSLLEHHHMTREACYRACVSLSSCNAFAWRRDNSSCLLKKNFVLDGSATWVETRPSVLYDFCYKTGVHARMTSKKLISCANVDKYLVLHMSGGKYSQLRYTRRNQYVPEFSNTPIPFEGIHPVYTRASSTFKNFMSRICSGPLEQKVHGMIYAAPEACGTRDVKCDWALR